MMLQKPDFNWGNLWADLLKGVGRGLLVHDGSRLSQATLAGLEVFDDAQERRRHRETEKPNGGAYQDTLLKLWATMSPKEQAAFRQLPLEEQEAWMEEAADGPNDDAANVGDGYPPIGIAQPAAIERSLPHQNRPLSANPIDRWHLQSILPFGPDGALKLPTYRR
jgi:hypothetical protein